MGDAAAEQKDLTSVGEKASYGLYFVGQNIFYFLIVMFLVPFFTDVGIPAITVAGLALVVKVWDAVNDPIFGGIVDKVKFKKGKFLPWLRISLIFIPLSTVAIFAIPTGISISLKVAWAAIAYILWDTSYTICDVPVYGIVTTMTDRLHERTTLMAIARIAAGVGSLAVTVTVPMIRSLIGGWLPLVATLSGIALLTMCPLCFKAKERIEVRNRSEDISVKDMFRFLKGNKYMLIYWTAFILARTFDVGYVLNMYFARYNLGDEKLLGTISMITALPSLIAAVLVPFICKRVDKFKLFFWSTLGSIVFAVASYFAGYGSFTVVVIFAALRGIPYGLLGVLMFMFTPDCVEYGTYKTGVPASGIAFSLQTFSQKLLAALSAAVGATALSVIGFIEGEGAVQAAGFADKLFFVYMLFPAIGSLIALPLLSRYKLTDKKVGIMIKANNGEITRGEAEKLLGDI
ncbi:sodium:galactoside symporter [Spirochaetia bacterium]|nr:sodium:galactoside symporter [Spirochaetia bacterium]